MNRLLLTALLVGASNVVTGFVSADAPIVDGSDRPRVLVLTDIGNEPDDSQSLVRFLLYSSDYDVEGIYATTSKYLQDTMPELIEERVAGYEAVYNRLQVHHPEYPQPQEIHNVIGSCQTSPGMAGVGVRWDSDGSRRIIEAVDSNDPRPLWVSVWGGGNCLAQALWRVANDRSPEQLEVFVDKIRVYSISDQDDSGVWMRESFPGLAYIVSPNTEAEDGEIYGTTTWSGISGDYIWPGVYIWQRWICIIKQLTLAWGCSDPPGGPDFETVANPWLDRHIRRGPLGSLYPNTWYIMEGDSPSFMNLIDNGLGAYRSPAWGGWGGRYTLLQPDGESRPVWTNSNDTVAGTDGESVTSNQATVWRWRDAYQQDFASRIQWTLTGSYSEADHPPKVIVNDNHSERPILIAVIPGQEIHLDTSASYDPDGQPISFHYWQYREAGSSSAEIGIAGETDSGVTIVVPPNATEGDVHLIVEARDSGGLVRYARIVLTIRQGSINLPLTSGSR